MNRRGFLKGLMAAPVVITTPGLLMPIKPRLIEPDYGDPWRLWFRNAERQIYCFSRAHKGKYQLRQVADRQLFDPDPAFDQFRAALAT